MAENVDQETPTNSELALDQDNLVESLTTLSIHGKTKQDVCGTSETELEARTEIPNDAATNSESIPIELPERQAEDESVSASVKEEPVQQHLELIIPSKECASMIYAEKYAAKKMMHLTGAKVTIGFHEAGVSLKARGDATSLQKVRETLVNIAKKSSCMITDPQFGRMLVPSTNVVLFEQNTSLGDTMTFHPYEGTIQPDDDGMQAFLPTLDKKYTYCDKTDDLSFQKYMDNFCQQMRHIKNDYIPTTHGMLRMVISFGTIYMIHVEPSIRRLRVTEFEELQQMRYGTPTVQRGQRGQRGGYRGRGRGYNFRQGTRNIHLQQLPRGAFIAYGAKDVDQSISRIRDLGFSLVRSAHYNNLGIAINTGQRRPCDCTLILDGDFNFIELRLPDTRWVKIDVRRMSNEKSRCADGEEGVPDVRLKMISRRVLHPEEIAKPKYEDDLGAFISRTTKPLYNTEQGKLAVNPKFTKKQSMVRQKQKAVYGYTGSSDNTSAAFLNTIQFHVTHVKEFSRPDPYTGEFGHVVDDRPEITIRCEMAHLPNLQDKNAYKSFATELWNFAMSFGDTV